MKRRWWQQAIFYELYVDKFAGNFRLLGDRLPYLADLGVNCIHLLPYYPSPMKDGGYDVSDYRGVRRELGTLEDFDRFAENAAAHDIKVMVDLVLNHTSIAHPWFREALSDPKSPKRNYYLWSKTGAEFPDAINSFSHAKPKNWIVHEPSAAYYFATFYPEQPDLNWDNPAVFEEMAGIMDFWVSHGVSAFRLDAVSHLVKREGTNCKNLPETHAVIKKLRVHVDKNYPEVALNGEVHSEIERMLEYFGDGDECHLLYHFPLAEALITEAVLGGNDRSSDYIRHIEDVPPSASWLAFLRNHDELSLSTLSPDMQERFLTAVDPESRLRFGNGVASRLRSICSRSPAGEEKCLREVYERLFSVSASILLYAGDEIGMQNLPVDPGVRDVRIYGRGEFAWSEAERQRRDPGSLFSLIKGLAAKRKNMMP